MLSLKEKAERFPPIVCRLLARKKVRHDFVEAMTDHDIRAASGLPMATIKRLSWSHSWDAVPLADMLAFSQACGVDFDDPQSMKRNTRYLNNGGQWAHLMRSPERNTLYMPLYEEWRKAQG